MLLPAALTHSILLLLALNVGTLVVIGAAIGASLKKAVLVGVVLTLLFSGLSPLGPHAAKQAPAAPHPAGQAGAPGAP